MNNNTRRLFAILQQSIKEHTQQWVTNWLDLNHIHPQDYEDIESDHWYPLIARIFHREFYISINIFPTPDLIIRCLNFIKETELSKFGGLISFQDPEEEYNIVEILRNTAFLLVEFEIIDIFKNWVIECFQMHNELRDVERQ